MCPSGILERLSISWLQEFYGRHHDLVYLCNIFISQMTMDLFPFTQKCSWLHRMDALYTHRYCLFFANTWRHFRVFGRVPVGHHFVFCVVILCLILSSSCGFCTQYCQCLVDCHSWLTVWFSSTFIYNGWEAIVETVQIPWTF